MSYLAAITGLVFGEKYTWVIFHAFSLLCPSRHYLNTFWQLYWTLKKTFSWHFKAPSINLPGAFYIDKAGARQFLKPSNVLFNWSLDCWTLLKNFCFPSNNLLVERVVVRTDIWLGKGLPAITVKNNVIHKTVWKLASNHLLILAYF